MITYVPTADIRGVGFTPSTGATSFGTVDETTTDDADYTEATVAGAYVDMALPVTALDDTNTIKYRASSPDGANGLTVELREQLAPTVTTRKREWTRQPQIWTPADAKYGLLGLWNGATDADAVSRIASVGSASSTKSANRYGKTIKVTGTSALSRYLLGNSAAHSFGANDFTVATVFQLDSTAGYTAVSKWHSGGDPASCEWLLGANNGFASTVPAFTVAVGSGAYSAIASSGSWSVGIPYFLVGRRQGTTIKVDRWNLLDLSRVSGSTTNAGITTVNTVSARNLKLNEIDLGMSYNGDSSYSLIFSALRSMSDAELQDIMLNFWQLFHQPEEIVYHFPTTLIATQSKTAGELGTTPSEHNFVLTSGEKAAVVDPAKLLIRAIAT